MASAIFAYAFLKAAYSEGVRNPVDAVSPLVKRALMKFGSHEVDQLKVQQRIKNSIGIEIPLNVIRYTFPRLTTEGILKLENRMYRLVDKNFVDHTVTALEDTSRAQYERIKTKISRFFIDHNVVDIHPDDFIEEWLDDSALSFLGGDNPAFSANTKDREINRLMYLVIEESYPKGEFLDDLTGIVLGDSLYRAIKAITEIDIENQMSTIIPSKMEEVEAYFDTRFVMRALGFGADQFTHAAQELLGLCKSTGCRISIFQHNIAEIQRVIRTVADLMNTGREIDGDIASYALDHGLDPGDLIDLASRIDDEVHKLGLSIKEAPPLTVEMSIDERELDNQLRVDLNQANVDARIADVSSLAAIYRLRGGKAVKFLEKCKAIFITSNKGLADSSVRHFQPLFREAGEVNQVQLCMTDVVFSTRLWTKLPTSLEKLPREQIIAHIMGHLRPSTRLQESFVQHLRGFVSEGRLSEEAATTIRLSRFVQQALAVDFDANKTSLTRSEFVSVAKVVVEKQKALQEKIRESVKENVRTQAKNELDEALKQFKLTEREVADRDSDIEILRKEISSNAAQIEVMSETHDRVEKKISKIVTYIIRGILIVCLFWLFDSIFSTTSRLAEILNRMGYPSWAQYIVNARSLVDAISAAIFTFLTLGGLSLVGAQRAIETGLVRRIMNFIFK